VVEVVGENHGGGHYGPGEASAAGFVAAGLIDGKLIAIGEHNIGLTGV
jgi:hypothetical protein